MTSQTNGQFDRTPLIAGNWKMNMDHAQAITLLQKLAWTLDDAKHDYSRAEVAVFPPFTDLRSVQSLVDGDDLRVVYGAQDLSDQDSGAYTGDISGQFLAKLGCTYVLVGHSERRTIHGESDELCNAKIAAAHRHGLVEPGGGPLPRLREPRGERLARLDRVHGHPPPYLWVGSCLPETVLVLGRERLDDDDLALESRRDPLPAHAGTMKTGVPTETCAKTVSASGMRMRMQPCEAE